MRNSIPDPTAAGSIRRASVAMNGLVLSGELRPVMFECGLRADDLLGLADTSRSLDADGRRLAEVRHDAVLALERGLDDFLLDLAVQRDRDLMPGVVLADVDERVLLRKLRERRAERTLLLWRASEHHGFERRSREARSHGLARWRFADRVAHPDRSEPSEGRHLACRDGVASWGARRREDPDRRWLCLVPAADSNPLSRLQGAREEPNVGDALTRGRAFDLEHPARNRCRGITALPHEQLVDAGEELRDADASPRGADKDRVDVDRPLSVGQGRPGAGHSSGSCHR